VAGDVAEAAAVRAAACAFIAACLSNAAVSGSLDNEAAGGEGVRQLAVLAVAPLLRRRDVWRSLSDILIACAPTAPAGTSGTSGTKPASQGSSAGSDPAVTDPAAVAALRRGAASALLAAARVAPAVVAVAMSPRPGDAPPAPDGGDDWPPAWSAALAALNPTPWWGRVQVARSLPVA
jgi:hypothetical protein